MPRKFTEDVLVLATHNKGKIKEIGKMLEPYVPSFKDAGTLGLSEPEETGKTFEDNAILKARAAVSETGFPALADDSGLSVHALGGEPGIYSARWAGPERDFTLAMSKVHEKLGDAPDRSASFVCVLALAWPDGHVETVRENCDGALIWPPVGDGGFGYDPIFVPESYTHSFAELGDDVKRKISHRAKAFQSLVEQCFA